LTASIVTDYAQLFQLVTSDISRELINFREHFEFTPREINCFDKIVKLAADDDLKFTRQLFSAKTTFELAPSIDKIILLIRFSAIS
jgi:hypothetical protein